jgi:hypothetical protein
MSVVARNLGALPVLLCLLGACADLESGHLEGLRLEVPDCDGIGRMRTFEPFRLAFRHVSVNREGTGATVRLSPSAAEPLRTDQVVFSIPDAFEAKSLNGNESVVPLALDLDASAEGVPGKARLNVVLMQSCRNRSAALVGRGRLELDSWGDRDGDRVAGRLEVDVVDPRTGEVRGAAFEGHFDLRVDTGTPFNAFAPRHF